MAYINEATLPSESTNSTQGNQSTILGGAILSESKDTTFEPQNQEISKENSASQKEMEQKMRTSNARAVQQKEGRFYRENAELGAPLDFRDHVMRAIATGGVKFIWGNNAQNGTRGLAAHTGFKEEERRKRIGILSNEGMYPEVAAEQLLSSYADEIGYDPGIDTMDALSEIIDVVMSYSTPKEMMQAVQQRHQESEEKLAQQEADFYEGEYYKQKATERGMSVAEYLLEEEMYEEVIAEELIERDTVKEEIDAIFVEQYLDEYENERRNQSLHQGVSGQTRNGADNEGGSNVLPTAGSNQPTAIQRSAERQGADAQVGNEGNNDISPRQAQREPGGITEVTPQQKAANKHAKALVKRINEWTKSLGVEAVIYNSVDEVESPQARKNLKKGAKITGWYKDGKVYFYLPNLRDVSDVNETLIHETVAHHGLRALLGEEGYRDLCRLVYNEVMTDEQKADKLDYVRKHEPVEGGRTKGKATYEEKIAAGDEYMAFLAENTYVEYSSAFDKITSMVRKALRAIGFDVKLSGEELRDILRQSYANLQKQGGARTITSESSITIDDFSGDLTTNGIRFNIRTDEAVVANREKQLKRNVRNGILSSSEADEIREASQAMLEIAEVIAQAKKEDGEAQFPSFSQWNGLEVKLNANGEPVVSVVKVNGEYPMNLDFAKDCIKRDATNRVLNRLAQVAPEAFTSLTNEQLAEINNIIKRHGLSVPCVGCFVEAKRYRSADYARSVVSVWNKLVEAVNSQKETEVVKELGNKQSVNAIIAHLKKTPSDMMRLSEDDIVAPDKYAALMIEHPQIPRLLQHAQGQNNAQLVVPEAIYYGDVLNLAADKAWDVDAAYTIGGVRLQSFSDFKAKLFFDYCQVLADLASKKLPAHTYTKVPSYAELFGLTGMKINLSLFFEGKGIDENGEYIYSQESIDPAFAYDIQSRDGYTENVGTMAVGVSDGHIKKMLADDRIRSISPYHKSGINPMVAKKINAADFMDYTNEQNAVIAKSEKMADETWAEHYQRITARVEGKVPSYGAKVTPEFNLYDDLLDTEDPIETAKNYVEYCQNNGIVPKFAHFVYNEDGSFNDGYFKLLYDFAVTDKDGNYAPQKAVKWNKSSMPANTAEILTSALEVEEATLSKNQAQVNAVVDDILEEVVKPRFRVNAEQPIEGYTSKEIIDIITPEIENVISENDVEGVEIAEVWLHGSRLRGDAQQNSDLDAVLFYKGNAREDDLFNLIAENDITINGVRVDVNPIQIDSVEDIAQYKRKSQQYDAEKLTQANGKPRFRVANYTDEEKEIIAKAKADGTYLKAPNGKQTNLTPKQWAQVRTKAFKEWFGDWEKSARIEKLKGSKDAVITGEEIEASDDLKQYRKNAQVYGRTLQGQYTNADTGSVISLHRGRHNGGINEVLQHNYKDVAHLQSVAAIPQIIENGIYIESQHNRDVETNPNVSEYQIFVCGLNIGGEDYTVLAKVAVDKNGNRYYDHNLVSVEKGKLIDIANNNQSAKSSGFGTTPDTKSTTNSQYKFKEIISILQINSSKIVDANGEPKVVWHGGQFGMSNFTPRGAMHFGTMMAAIDRLIDQELGGEDGFEVTQTDNGGYRWDYENPYDEELVGHSTQSFATKLEAKADAMQTLLHDTVIKSYFLNIRNLERTDDAGSEWDNTIYLSQEAGYDGIVYENWYEDKGSDSYIAFNPHQIKSATDNVGTFDVGSNDVRFRVQDEATEAIFATAKEKFGTTYDMREAGYILPDGSMLDFSGKHEIRGADTSFLNGQRSVDHRAIQEIAYDFDENETGVETDMGDFLDRGAIRIDYNTGNINLNNAPTKAQKDRLKRLIERNGGDVYIDFGKGWETEHYVEYESARASRILGDIDRYFDEGIKPSGNIRFRVAYASRFKDMQREYDTLDKNDEMALNAWRDEKADVVRGYLEKVKRVFNLPDDVYVFNGAREEEMQKAYDYLVERLKENGITKIPSFETFKKKASNEKVRASHRRKAALAIFNVGKRDWDNSVGGFFATLFHENTHNLVEGMYSEQELKQIWDEAKAQNHFITREVMEYYADKSDIQKGNEFIAKAIGYLAKKHANLLRAYIKGEGNISVKDVVKRLKYKSRYGNFVVEEILNKFKENYGRKENVQRAGGSILGGSRDGRYTSVSSGYRRPDSQSVGVRRRGDTRRDVRLRRAVITPEQQAFYDAVAQKGLREVVGKDIYDAFYNGLYGNVDMDVRKVITDYAIANNWDYDTGIKQYLTSLAENTDTPLDNGVRESFMRMLETAGVETDGLTDNDIRYMLWRTNQLQTSKGAVAVAEDVVMKQNLGVGNFRTRVADNTRQEYEVLRQAVMSNNSLYAKNKPIETAFTANNFYIYENYGDDSFSIIKRIPIDGNEELIGYYENLIQDGTYRDDEELGKVVAEFRREQEQRNSGERNVEERRGGNARPISMDIRQSPDRGADNEESDSDERKIGDNIRFRIARPSTGEAKDYYNKAVRTPNKSGSVKKSDNLAHRLQEAYQDSMLSVRELMEGIRRETGAPYIKDMADVYTAENRLSSTNKAQIEAWERDFFAPLMEEVIALTKEGAAYEDILEYIVAKHGLERNLVFSQRDAEKDGGVWDGFVKKDYSGLTELTGEAERFTEAAQQIVDEFEQKYNTQNLWDAINNATKTTLKKSFDSGMMSKETYDNLTTMFKHYVPLRGWANDVAADEYEYMGSSNMKILPTLKTAKGRTSLAEDPLATIGTMGESAIIQGNKNLMKQKLLNLALQYPTSLLSVSEQWYVKQPNGKWIVDSPYIPEGATGEEVAQILADHETQMEALGSKATKQREGLDLDLHLTRAEGQEHAVRVKRNGKEYVVYVNGNPIAAQAINGFTNPNAATPEDWMKTLKEKTETIKNYMARAFTSANPAFVISNLSRDVIWAGTAVAIKENAAYTAQYTKNITREFLKAELPRLIHKWQNGTLDENVPIERFFKEFLLNGGETGFTQLNTVDAYKKNMRRKLKEAQKRSTAKAWKAVRGVVNGIEFLNRSAEDTTRFAVYMTSRQMGRSVARSIDDAKNITVNFNRKGRGNMGAAALGYMYIFFNAAVQSIANFGKLVKEHPIKTTSWISAYGSAGFLTPIITMAIQSLIGDDDDESSYWNLPEWVRRNNLVLPLGANGYVTVPLPHELRPFYAIGEIALSVLAGKEDVEDGLRKAVAGFAGMLPVDPTGNAGDMVINLTPTFAQPIMQIARNTDFFGVPIYKDSPFNQNAPEWTKANKGTSPLLVNGTRIWNEIWGGDAVKSSAIDEKGKKKALGDLTDVNPAIIEHLFESYLGGMGKTYNKLVKTIGMIWNEDLRTMRNVPILSSFVYFPDEQNGVGGEVNTLYYDATDEARETERIVSGYKKQVKMGAEEYAEKLDEFLKSPLYQRYKVIRPHRNEVNKLRKELEDKDVTNPDSIEQAIFEMKEKMIKELEELESRGYEEQPDEGM